MSYIGQGLPADTFQGFTTDKFTGDGTANKTFTLTKEPFSEDTILVTIDGVVQEPTDDFTVSGTTLTLVGTAPNNSEVNVTHMGGPLPIGGASELDLNGASDKLILDADGDTTISADTDDQVDIKIGGTDRFSIASTGATTITTADNTDTLTLKSTDADAAVGPVLTLHRESSSPADDDIIGRINFIGEDSGGTDTTYGRIETVIMQESNGSEDATMEFRIMKAGTERNVLELDRGEVCINEDSQDVDFRVESDNLDDALFVEGSTGYVGIGTNTPQDNLDVTSAGDSQVIIRCAGTSNDSFLSFRSGTALHWYIHANFNAGDEVLYFIDYAEGSNNIRMTFATNGVISGNFNDTSDIALKKEVTTLPSSDFVKNLNPVSFKWKEDDREDKGFIAQEIEALDSSLVDGKEGQKAINVTGIVAQLTKSLQEAMAKIETLETKVKALEDA